MAESMKITDIALHQVPFIESGMTLHDAGNVMETTRRGLLPVVENGRLAGTLSVRELALSCCIEGCEPRRTTVADIINRHPVVCAPEHHLASALELMQAHRLTELMVVGRDGEVVGVISSIELLALLKKLLPEETDGPELESVRRVRGG